MIDKIRQRMNKVNSRIQWKYKEDMSDEELLQQLLACIYGINDVEYRRTLIYDIDEIYREQYGIGYVVRAWNEYMHEINRLSKIGGLKP